MKISMHLYGFLPMQQYFKRSTHLVMFKLQHMRTCQYLVHETDHSSLKDSFRHRSGRDPFKKILGGVCLVFKLDVIPKNLETDRE